MSTNYENVSRPEVRNNFSKIPNQLIVNDKLHPFERLIAIYIMSYKTCYVSQATMSRDLAISKSTVQRNMSALLRKNVVRKVGRPNSWECVYVVNPLNKWKLE